MEIITERGEKISITKISFRELSLNSPSELQAVTMKYSDEITQVDLGGTLIKVNSIILIKERGKFIPFHINYITKLGKGKYSLLVTRLTNTAKFLSPIHFTNAKTMLFKSNFINAYIGINKQNITGTLFYVYRYTGDIPMYNLEKSIKESDYFVDSFQVDNYHVIYEMRVPLKYVAIYEIFMQGKYSKFPDWYKDQLKNFYLPILNTSWNKTTTYKILYKDPTYRKKLEAELDVDIPSDAELADAITEKEFFSHEFSINDTKTIS